MLFFVAVVPVTDRELGCDFHRVVIGDRVRLDFW